MGTQNQGCSHPCCCPEHAEAKSEPDQAGLSEDVFWGGSFWLLRVPQLALQHSCGALGVSCDPMLGAGAAAQAQKPARLKPNPGLMPTL